LNDELGQREFNKQHLKKVEGGDELQLWHQPIINGKISQFVDIRRKGKL